MSVLQVENGLNFETGEWVQHWMAAAEVELPIDKEGERWQDAAGMWHLRAWQAANGVVRFVSGPFETVEVVWEGGAPHAGERVRIPWGVSGWLLRVETTMREAIAQAVAAYTAQYGHAPDTVYVRRIPKGAEEGMLVHDAMLMQASWVPGRCVFVCSVEAVTR